MVCLDSNALTYLYDSMTSKAHCPVDQLAIEKIAMLRIYLYFHTILHYSPTAKLEYQRIKTERKRVIHEQIANALLREIPPAESCMIEARTNEYFCLHRKINDCRLLSECELGGGKVLLTYDNDLLKRLRGKTQMIEISPPSEFWARLEIPKGSSPPRTPSSSNPLSKETWWVW